MNNPSEEALPGDIMHGKNNRNTGSVSPHFIICPGPDPTCEDHFPGAMLTTSPRFSNVALKPDHFE